MTDRRIGIPPGKQLRVVFRVSDGWLVFTDCPSPGADLADMLGSGLHLKDDGTAYAFTWRGGVGNDTYMRIK